MVMVPAMVEVGMVQNPEEDEAPDTMMLDPGCILPRVERGDQDGRRRGYRQGHHDGSSRAQHGRRGGSYLQHRYSGCWSRCRVPIDTASTDNTVNEEWVKLPVIFVWKSGGEMPVAIGGGYVDVSFHPVSSLGGVSFDDSKMPRFVASNDPVKVVEIDDCTTTLLFPFVTNKARLRYRNSHYEYFGGIRLLHHHLPRCRCS